MKLLIGGSPCTHWSIARRGRETEPTGLGWELFKAYADAIKWYMPDYFLYENNYSIAAAIREAITKELGVPPVMINSALVSAQTRKRLYWVGRHNKNGSYDPVPIEQPEDRGILLRDILESGEDLTSREKGYALTATYGRAVAWETLQRHKRTMVAEPVRVGTIESGVRDASHEVVSGQITIKGKQYPVKLRDGRYVVRKLTVKECMRLQTVPEDYVFPVSKTQAYKMIGNGWTVDVVVHILKHFAGIETEPVEVLSMYDGMSCGQIALKKLGASVVTYYATEIDRFCIETTAANFPATVQLGDALNGQEWRKTIKAREQKIE